MKQKRKKNIDKIKEFEIDLVKFKHANNPNKLQSELKELDKIQVIDKNLHEIKQEILQDYTGEFEMVGNLVIKFDKHILDSEILMILKLILTLLMKVIMRKMLFLMVIIIN